MKSEPFKIKAIITIEIDAADAYAIETHRRELKALVADLRSRHGPAHLDVKARRPRRTPHAGPPPVLAPGFEIIRARYAG